jgi:hypothetical protein
MTTIFITVLSLLDFLLIGVASFKARRARTLSGLLKEQTELSKAMRVELDQKSEEMKRLSAESAEHFKIRTQTVEMIGVSERERNVWKEKYLETAIGHSGAQEMMMREIGRLVLLCRRNKIDVRQNPALVQVRDEFEKKFVAPIAPEDVERIAGSLRVKPVDKPA